MNLRIIPLPPQIEAVIHALLVQMRRVRVQRGCIQCHISQDAQEENVILYQEEWNSWNEIETHIRSIRFNWILELIEQSSNAPELSFSDVREIRGMDYVRKLRTVK